MSKKKTIATSLPPTIDEALTNFAKQTGDSKSSIVGKVLGAFFQAYNTSRPCPDPEDYAEIVATQSSYYCPTSTGVLMSLNMQFDFIEQC